MKRIVVGTDLSARSRAAVDYAADLAATQGAVLHLVCACTVPTVTSAVDIAATPTASDVIEPSKQELAAIADTYRNRDIEVEEHVCVGSAAESLCRVADSVEADLIVVGNKRVKGKARVLGSVPNRVARNADCHVLIVNTGGS